MSDDASFSSYPVSYSEKNTRRSHFITIFFAILLVVVVLLVGLYFLGVYKKSQLQQGGTAANTKQIIPSPSAVPTATPTPVALKKSELSVIVLNGSGVAGAAGEISTLLKDLGYTVKSVGNASKFDYTGITIFIKQGKKEYLEQLKKDLVKEDSGIETAIDDKIKADVEIVVGK